MAPERQADAAIRLYESRSAEYDKSWHPSFTKLFASYLNLSPGQHVLDLACGTGLLSLLEAEAVGPSGRVVGVDVTPGMLSQARAKKQSNVEKYENLEFYEGSVLNLEAIETLRGQTFDVITLASALVLFPNPEAAVQYWTMYLKPGGIIATDSTHPRTLISGMLLERIGKRLDLAVPYNREWSKSEQSLKEVLESAGLKVEQLLTVANQRGIGTQYYEMSDAEGLFEKFGSTGDAAVALADQNLRQKAKVIFKEEFEKLAVDGKVEEIDAVFFGVARKSVDRSSVEVLFSGGCRCGGVRYIGTSRLSDITACHCRACRHLSGSAFLPFSDVPVDSFRLTSSSTLQTLKLSDVAKRTFCSSCGSPITMAFNCEADSTSLVMSSIDEGSFKGEWPKVQRHIYLREKAPWMVLPEDGAERQETFSFAHLAEPEGKSE